MPGAVALDRDDDAQTFAHVDRDALLRAIEALPDTLRPTARRRWMLDERPYRIAEAMDCPVYVVQMRLRLAYEAISELLAGFPHHECVHRVSLRQRALLHVGGCT